MRSDLSPPRRCDGIMPIVDTAAIILALGIALRQVEFNDAGFVVRQNLRTDRLP